MEMAGACLQDEIGTAQRSYGRQIGEERRADRRESVDKLSGMGIKLVSIFLVILVGRWD